MKQNITQKQWDKELTIKKQLFFIENTPSFKAGCRLIGDDIESILEFPNIGQMIEFLEEKTEDAFVDKYFDNQIHIGFNGEGLQGCNSNISIGWDGNKKVRCGKKEFCNALWEAVKNKLRKI